ncbi:MAG: beta-propeller fold lactonase family protein, partial [Verrucomicrobiota bacterium]
GGNEIEVSPDGKEVWALGTESDSIVRFRRNQKTGLLTFVESIFVKGPNPKVGPSGICFSKDSRFAYIADEHEAALVVYERVAK